MIWEPATADPASIDELSRQLSISKFLARLLVTRGVDTVAEATRFLEPRLADFLDPRQFPEVEHAARRLARAIMGREKVIIYGDYDVDGITSVTLLLSFFRDLGFAADYQLPNRFVDGYGLNLGRVEEMVADGYSLLVTVDCGSANADEVSYLTDNGVDVIVTDHHRLQHERPQGYAFVNPMAWEDFPEYQELAGVGVAYVLMMATYLLLREDNQLPADFPPLKHYLDVVTLGTVADMVPLRGPNRALVVHGLRSLKNGSHRPGINALREVANQSDKPFDETTIAFYMAPRINAAGRLGRADVGVDLLMAGSHARALGHARTLDTENTRRRELEKRIYEEACQILEAELEHRDVKTIVLASPHWHQGVVGIVASRLCERYYRPTVLLKIEGDSATGSARSIAGFNIAEALKESEDLLERFGGHSMAAGLTIHVDRIPALQRALDLRLESSMTPESLEPRLTVDVEVSLEDVTQTMILDIGKLSPFGIGNPEPVLASTGVTVRSRKIVGGDHLKMDVEQDGRRLEAIAFRMANAPVRVGDEIDIAYLPEVRSWHGLTFLQLRIKDLVTR